MPKEPPSTPKSNFEQSIAKQRSEKVFYNIYTALRTMPDYICSIKQDITEAVKTVRFGENYRLYIQILYKGKPLDVHLNGKIFHGIHPYEIPPKGIVIGRDSTCQWRVSPVDAIKTSRHHAILTINRKFYILRRNPAILKDLDSTYGIKFLDTKVSEIPLKAGVHCQLGDVELVVNEEKNNLEDISTQTKHRLQQLNGENKGRFFELTKNTIVIGSAPNNGESPETTVMTIVCNHPSVSRNHATLLITDQGRSCKIIDPNSKNGTRINGESLSHNLTDGRKLQDGDEISLGYIRFRYFQRDSVPFIQAILVSLATLAIVAFLCMLYAWLSPTASYYIRKSDSYSAIGNYDKALISLSDARASRHGDAYTSEIGDREQKISKWKETLSIWNKIQKDLMAKNTEDAWKKLRPLILDSSSWPQDKPLLLTEAKLVDTLLMNLIEAKKIISNPIPLFEDNGLDIDENVIESTVPSSNIQNNGLDIDKNIPLTSLIETLKHNADNISHAYLEALKPTIKSYALELAELVRQQKVLKDILGNIYKKPLGISEAKTKVISEIERIETHVQEMDKQGNISYSCVLDGLKEMLPHLNQLSEAESIHYHNVQCTAKLEVNDIHKQFPLPKPEAFKGWSSLEKCRERLEKDHLYLQERIALLTSLVGELKDAGIRNNEISQAMNDVLNSPNKNVLSCAFLRENTLRWDDARRSPIPGNDYDHLLGIELFRDFLDTIPSIPDKKWEMDSRLLDERPFIPSIFLAHKHYGIIEDFLNVVDQTDECAESLKSCLPKEENSLVALANWSHQLLSKRYELAGKWMHMSQSETSLRKSLILGGMALALVSSPGKYYNEDLKRLNEQYQTLKKVLAKQWKSIDGRMTANDRQNVLNYILNNGLPGDPIVKKALEASGRWK